MLCKELLSEGYNYIKTEKLVCQDNLEQHFAHQRQAGGTNRAPTSASYINNEKRFSVLREMQLPSRSGNCRGGVISAPRKVDNTKLPTGKK